MAQRHGLAPICGGTLVRSLMILCLWDASAMEQSDLRTALGGRDRSGPLRLRCAVCRYSIEVFFAALVRGRVFGSAGGSAAGIL